YYHRVRELGARYHAAVVDFADHDADRYFCADYTGHLSPRGWVYYAQVLDGFFHDRLPPQSELPALAAGKQAGAALPSRPAPGSRPPDERSHGPSSATASHRLRTQEPPGRGDGKLEGPVRSEASETNS